MFHGILASSKARIALAVMWGAFLVWLVPEKSRLGMPIMLIAVGLPLIFRLVPRNWLYGLRTPYTLLNSEETWYRQNVITGVAMVGVGVVWLGVLVIRG